MKRIGVIILSVALISNLGMVFAQDTSGHEHKGHHRVEEPKVESLGLCPITGEKAYKEYSYTYAGKTYYFCCPMCIEEFKKDPQKYISKVKEIKLEAFQYGFSPDPVVVKVGDIVKLEITSRDVTHGVYIKEYGINVAVKKGETKKIEFLADKKGKFNIICSVYCGPGHHQMKATLIVE